MELKITQTTSRIRGQDTVLPAIELHGRTILVAGKWLKIATVKDETFVNGEVLPDPVGAVNRLREWKGRPDIFIFPQKFADPEPHFPYYCERHNFAVIPITTYDDWLKNRIRKDVKENIRRAKREGVEARVVPFDDTFVAAVKRLFDETPYRQGRRFWHFNKSFEQVKDIVGTYCERAEYIGAFLGDEMVGFIKMVYVDNFAKTMHVISGDKYHSKRPTNALLAKAVEVCAAKGIAYFVYGEYRFSGKKTSSLTEFKRHNGFEEREYPRYFVPLTLKGQLAVRLRLYRDPKTFLPFGLTQWLLKLRASYYQKQHASEAALAQAPAPAQSST